MSETPAAARVATTLATVTLIGPVGPLTWAGVPPNKAARKPTTTAPYKPYIAPPGPSAALPKARASGSATTAAVSPPKTSPLTFLR